MSRPCSKRQATIFRGGWKRELSFPCCCTTNAQGTTFLLRFFRKSNRARQFYRRTWFGSREIHSAGVWTGTGILYCIFMYRVHWILEWKNVNIYSIIFNKHTKLPTNRASWVTAKTFSDKVVRIMRTWFFDHGASEREGSQLWANGSMHNFFQRIREAIVALSSSHSVFLNALPWKVHYTVVGVWLAPIKKIYHKVSRESTHNLHRIKVSGGETPPWRRRPLRTDRAPNSGTPRWQSLACCETLCAGSLTKL